MKHCATSLFVAWLAGSACGGGNGNPTPTQPQPQPQPAPTISSINPNSGTAAGGTAVTITGANFASGATATIGSVALTGVTVSSTTISGTTGASSTAGSVNVTVNFGGQTATLTNGFTYNSVPRAVISGAPTTTQHDTAVTFSGMTSSTTNPFSIQKYQWNCGQDPAVYDSTGRVCLVDNNVTPMFTYRKCNPSGQPPVANRPACDSGNQKTYTVRLTVTDNQNSQSSTTVNITVTNKY